MIPDPRRELNVHPCHRATRAGVAGGFFVLWVQIAALWPVQSSWASLPGPIGLGFLPHLVGLRCTAGEGPWVRQEVGGVGGHLIMVQIYTPHKWKSRELLAGELPGKGM